MELDARDDATPATDRSPETSETARASIGVSSVLADRYVVLEQLGEGGAGTVFAAFDRVLRTEVAVKCVGAATGDALLRFKSEFRAVQSFAHPNLIGLGELFEAGGDWFYSMERVEGVSFLRHVRPLAPSDALASAISNPSALSDATSGMSATSATPSSHGTIEDADADRTVQSLEARSESRVLATRRTGVLGVLDVGALRHVLAQLCDAVAVLHRAGQIHRDLKPGNVLVTRAGRVVVLDFGLSIRVGGSATTRLETSVMGTPGYMAPEQAFGTTITPAADWYAVGVMLYEALAGRRPFVGKSDQVLAAKRDVDPPPPSASAADVPADLEALAMALLARDPDARPGTAAIFERLDQGNPRGSDMAAADRARTTATDATRSSEFELASAEIFVGREVELDAVLGAYADVRRKRARRVLLTGPSGIGKSAALREALRRVLAIDGARPLLLRGRCYERERMAYNALDELVDVLTETLDSEFSAEERAAITPKDAALLARTFPVLRRTSPFDAPLDEALPDDPLERKARLFAAFRELLARLGRRRHVVLVLEDMQWADADSWAMLAECVREPGAPPVLIIGTARSELFDAKLGQAAETFALGRNSARVELGPLGRDAAAQMASRLGSDPFGIERLVDAAEGHPLFLELLSKRADSPIHATGPIVSMVRDALSEVALAQSEAARQLLACCALAGRPITSSALCQAAGLDGGALHRALRELRSANLVRIHVDVGHARESVETYHDQVRSAVLLHLPEARARLLHGALGLALAEEGASADVLYRHARGAGSLDEARTWAERAGDEAARALAFDQAAAFYEAAAEGLEQGSPAEVALALRTADALANAGRGEAAARVYLRVLPALPPEQVLPIQLRAAIELIDAGVFDEGRAAIGSVMEALGLAFPKSSVGAVMRLLLARAPLAFTRLDKLAFGTPELGTEERMRLELCRTGATIFSVTDPFLGGYFASLYLRLSVKAKDASHFARALGNEATANAYMGKDASSDALRARAFAIAGELDSPPTSAFLYGCEAAIELIRLEDLRRVLAASQRAIAGLGTVPTGAHLELRAVRLLEGNAYSIGGLYRGLAKVAETHVANARALGDQLSLSSWLLEYAVSVRWLVRDEADGLAESIEEGSRLAAARSPFHQYQVAISSSWLDLYRGDCEGAVGRLDTRLGVLSGSLALKAPILALLSAWCRARGALAWAESPALDSAARTRLRKRAEPDIRLLASASQTLCRGWAAQLDAALAYQTGKSELALASLGSAITLFDECRARGYAASARIEHGTLLGGERGRSERAEGLRYLVDQDVLDPEYFASVMLPGMTALVLGVADPRDARPVARAT